MIVLHPCTALVVKKKILGKEGIEVEDQILVWRGKALRDTDHIPEECYDNVNEGRRWGEGTKHEVGAQFLVPSLLVQLLLLLLVQLLLLLLLPLPLLLLLLLLLELALTRRLHVASVRGHPRARRCCRGAGRRQP